MAPQSSIFPIFLRAEYREDANGIPQFISRIQQAAKISEAELRKVGTALNNALSSPRTSGGGLDLGTAQLRELIKEQQRAAMAARELQTATLAAATANGGFNSALTPTINAFRDLAKAREADVASSRAQLAALQAVEAELEKGTSAVKARLQAEQNLANFRKTVNLNEGALRAAAGQASIDRAALSGATLESVLGRTRTANPAVAQQRAQEAAEMEKVAAAAAKQAAAVAELARAEAGAANAAQLLQAIYRGTSLELNKTGTEFARTAKSARESATAFQQAFAAQEAQAEKAAAALAALRAQINPTATAQDQYNQKVAFAQQAYDRGELSLREYAQALKLASSELRQAGQAEVAAIAARNNLTRATKEGTTARKSVINSVGAERTAFIQLGQQLQDMTVQAQMGTNAFIIMGQQLPQVAFALSGLEGSANRTKAAVGSFATLMSGPFGAAVFVGIAALGPLVQMFLESGDAADSAARSVKDLVAEKAKSAAEARNAAIAEDVFDRTLDGVTDAVRRNREAIERLTAAKRTDAEETLRNSRIQLAHALAVQFNTQQQLFNAKALLDAQVARATGPGQANELAALGIADRQANLDKALASLITGAGAIADIQKEINEASILVSVERGVDGAEGQIRRRYEAEIEGLKRTAAARGLSNQQIEREAAAIKAREEAEIGALRTSGRGSGAPRTRAERDTSARDQAVAARFAEQAVERVARINDRFAEQTRLVTQSLQANRELDTIIAQTKQKMDEAKNLTAAQREEFEKIIRSADDARQTIDDALVRPFQDLLRESDERLQVETLLAQGRADEAAGLQAVLQLQRQIGTEAELRAALQRAIADGATTEADRIRVLLRDYNQLMDEVRDRIVSEQRITRELRDQQAVFQAQLDVLGTVRRDLTAILSGRSTDFFGNFRQALQDLQGARMFEALFGQAFENIENQLQESTPQGRANAAYAQQVERTASATKRVGDAAVNLAEEFVRGFSVLRSGGFGAANDNGGFNPRFAMAQAAMNSIGGITVPGVRPSTVSIARPSVVDLAKRISDSIGESIGAQFEDLLGPRFASMLGDVIGGFIAGQALGGTPGGILGGLEGLTKNFKGLEGISEALGALGQGAQIGTQIAGLGKALGIRGSTTGAQIGGALGTPFGPAGQIVGSIIGNFVGGFLKKTPRASATIGGVGGGLGLTSVTGTSASLRDAASGLGGGVLETINRIAEQLGATVNAGAGSVSIGQRKGNIRVDPTGRGITKIGNGAIDFGQDSEAAIAFAVRNLIQDGVIAGLRQSEQNLLRAGSDIQAALQDVLTFRSVFDRLLEIRDPVAFATQQIDREFDRLRDVFVRAGATEAEFSDLEELRSIERARAIEEASDRFVGSLRQLLNDLRIGDSGLSLRTRRNNALGEFDALAARVAAGDTTAFDAFADISRQLLDIERQLFGSTQAYFDRLNQVTTLTERAISGQTNVSPMGVLPPSQEQANVARVIESTSADQVAILRAINDNLITLASPGLRAVGSGGGEVSPLPTFLQNF